MTRDTVLQAVSGMEILLDGRDTVARLGRHAVDCGPKGLAVIDAFREPRSLQDAASLLAPVAGTGIAWGELMAIVTRLAAAGLLVPAGAGPVAAASTRGFASATVHVSMLDDRERTEAFLRAISHTVRAGDVVIDLGTGTGVLAIAAVKAGARRVYAIEATAIADAAAAMFAANGVGDRITLVRGWSTQMAIDERADVLVSETLGNDPWEEGIRHLAADARRRFLRPEARVIPARVRVLAQPVTIPEPRRLALTFTPERTRLWSDWYRIDFAPLVAVRDAHTGVSVVSIEAVRSWPRPCAPVVLYEMDVASSASAPAAASGHLDVRHDGTIDGILLCWEADLAPGVIVSTHPDVTRPVSSWCVHLVLARDPQPVSAGDVVRVAVTFGAVPRLDVAIEPHDRTRG